MAGWKIFIIFLRLQNEKMNLLKSALKEREKDVEEKNARRIDDIKIRKTEQKNRLIAKIQRKKIKGENLRWGNILTFI